MLFGDEPVEPVEHVFQPLFELRRRMVLGQRAFEPVDVGESVEIDLLVGVGYVGVPFVQRFFGRGGLGAELAWSSRGAVSV